MLAVCTLKNLLVYKVVGGRFYLKCTAVLATPTDTIFDGHNHMGGGKDRLRKGHKAQHLKPISDCPCFAKSPSEAGIRTTQVPTFAIVRFSPNGKYLLLGHTCLPPNGACFAAHISFKLFRICFGRMELMEFAFLKERGFKSLNAVSFLEKDNQLAICNEREGSYHIRVVALEENEAQLIVNTYVEKFHSPSYSSILQGLQVLDRNLAEQLWIGGLARLDDCCWSNGSSPHVLVAFTLTPQLEDPRPVAAWCSRACHYTLPGVIIEILKPHQAGAFPQFCLAAVLTKNSLIRNHEVDSTSICGAISAVRHTELTSLALYKLSTTVDFSLELTRVIPNFWDPPHHWISGYRLLILHNEIRRKICFTRRYLALLKGNHSTAKVFLTNQVAHPVLGWDIKLAGGAKDIALVGDFVMTLEEDGTVTARHRGHVAGFFSNRKRKLESRKLDFESTDSESSEEEL